MFNELTLIGRAGKDPEVRSGNTTIATLSVATSHVYKDKQGNKVEETEWTRCVAFGKTAEVIQKYVHKGTLIMVKGRLKTSSYEKDGVTKYSTDCIIETLKLLSPAGNNSGTQQQAQKPQPKKEQKQEQSDDTPPWWETE